MSEPSSPPGTTDPSPARDADTGGKNPQPLRVGRHFGRVLALLVLVGIAALWAYAWWGPGVQRIPQGRTDSRTFSDQAEPICAATMTTIDQLPPAYESRDSAARGDVVTAANIELIVMLGRLEAIAPVATDGDDGRMINEWLADWRTFLGDRERYATALATDPGARMLVTEKERRQVSEPIDYFAKTNFMLNCGTPGDLA